MTTLEQTVRYPGVQHLFGGRSFYISKDGSDLNDGRTIATAWMTVAKVNATPKEAHDTFYFNGEDVFDDDEILEPVGSADGKRVRYTSYGSGKATLTAATGNGCLIENTNGIDVDTLRFRALGGTTNYGVYLHFNDGYDHEDIRIIGVEVEGFGSNGILGFCELGSTVKRFRAMRCVVRECTQGDTAAWGGKGTAGINLQGAYGAQVSGVYQWFDSYISACTVQDCLGANTDDNFTGSGIYWSQAQGCLVADSIARNCGGAGQWSYAFTFEDSKECVGRFNETYAQGATVHGGGAYLLGSGCLDCSHEYNFSVGCAGSAWLSSCIRDAGFITQTVKCFFRSNISADDAASFGNTLSIYLEGSGTICECDYFSNTAYSTRAKAIAYVPTSGAARGHMLNNIFYADGASTKYVEGGAVNITFRNNLYYGAVAATKFTWGGNDYSTIAAWRAAHPRQETYHGYDTHHEVDPQMVNPGGLTPDDYKLLPGSPITDDGFNITLALSEEYLSDEGNPVDPEEPEVTVRKLVGSLNDWPSTNRAAITTDSPPVQADSGNFRRYVWLPNDVVNPSLVYTGVTSGSVEQDTGNPVTYRAALWHQDTSSPPVWTLIHEFKKAGSATHTIASGTIAEETDQYVGTIPAGGYWLATHVYVQAGFSPAYKLYLTDQTRAAVTGQLSYVGVGVPDRHMDPSNIAAAGGGNVDFYMAGCVGIMGDVLESARLVGLVGDSISVGTIANPMEGAVGFAPGGAIGLYAPYMDGRYAYVHAGRAGFSAGGTAGVNYAKRRAFMAAVGVTDAWCNVGINDLGSGNQSAATVQSRLQTTFTALRSNIPTLQRIYMCTITPQVDDPVGDVTDVNQTMVGAAGSANLVDGRRLTLNDAIRAVGIPGQDYAVEIADLVQNSLNDHWWIAGYSSDGLHPNLTCLTAGVKPVLLATDPLAQTGVIHSPSISSPAESPAVSSPPGSPADSPAPSSPAVSSPPDSPIVGTEDTDSLVRWAAPAITTETVTLFAADVPPHPATGSRQINCPEAKHYRIRFPVDEPIEGFFRFHGNNIAKSMTVIGGEIITPLNYDPVTMINPLTGTYAISSQVGWRSTGTLSGNVTIVLATAGGGKIGEPARRRVTVPVNINDADLFNTINAAFPEGPDDALIAVVNLGGPNHIGGPWRICIRNNPCVGRCTLTQTSYVSGVGNSPGQGNSPTIWQVTGADPGCYIYTGHPTNPGNGIEGPRASDVIIFPAAHSVIAQLYKEVCHLEGLVIRNNQGSDALDAWTPYAGAEMRISRCKLLGNYHEVGNNWIHTDGLQCFNGPPIVRAELTHFYSYGGNGMIAQPREQANQSPVPALPQDLYNWEFSRCFFDVYFPDTDPRSIDPNSGTSIWFEADVPSNAIDLAPWLPAHFDRCYAQLRSGRTGLPVGFFYNNQEVPFTQYYGHWFSKGNPLQPGGGAQAIPSGVTIQALPPFEIAPEDEVGLNYNPPGYSALPPRELIKILEGNTVVWFPP